MSLFRRLTDIFIVILRERNLHRKLDYWISFLWINMTLIPGGSFSKIHLSALALRQVYWSQWWWWWWWRWIGWRAKITRPKYVWWCTGLNRCSVELSCQIRLFDWGIAWFYISQSNYYNISGSYFSNHTKSADCLIWVQEMLAHLKDWAQTF